MATEPGELSRRIDNRNIYRHLLRNSTPVGHKIRQFARILSFCFMQHWHSSAGKFSKFVQKIRQVKNIGVLLLQVTGKIKCQ